MAALSAEKTVAELAAEFGVHPTMISNWKQELVKRASELFALSEALARFGEPGIFNTDQGAQFTSDEFTKMLTDHGIAISMDGRGRCHDNIFVERLWWTVKHEWVYLRPAANGIEQKRSLGEFFDWYNLRRPHQALGWRTPDEAYLGRRALLVVARPCAIHNR